MSIRSNNSGLICADSGTPLTPNYPPFPDSRNTNVHGLGNVLQIYAHLILPTFRRSQQRRLQGMSHGGFCITPSKSKRYILLEPGKIHALYSTFTWLRPVEKTQAKCSRRYCHWCATIRTKRANNLVAAKYANLKFFLHAFQQRLPLSWRHLGDRITLPHSNAVQQTCVVGNQRAWVTPVPVSALRVS